MKNSNITTTLGIVFLISLIYSFTDNTPSSSEKIQKVELTGKVKEKALQKFILKPLDIRCQFDGKIHVAYTNLSDDLLFQITKTGLKYHHADPKKFFYRSSRSPLILKPQESTQREVDVDFLSRNKVAYVFKDDVKVFQLK